MNSSASRQKRKGRTIAAAADRVDDAYRALAASIPGALPADLTREELTTLEHVADGAGASLGWLAEHLGLPKSTASVLVKDLERRRFVRRRRPPQDERRLEVTLTAKGRRRVLAAHALDPGALGDALRALPRRDRIALVNALERLATAARDAQSETSQIRSRSGLARSSVSRREPRGSA